MELLANTTEESLEHWDRQGCKEPNRKQTTGFYQLERVCSESDPWKPTKEDRVFGDYVSDKWLI